MVTAAGGRVGETASAIATAAENETADNALAEGAGITEVAEPEAEAEAAAEAEAGAEAEVEAGNKTPIIAGSSSGCDSSEGEAAGKGGALITAEDEASDAAGNAVVGAGAGATGIDARSATDVGAGELGTTEVEVVESGWVQGMTAASKSMTCTAESANVVGTAAEVEVDGVFGAATNRVVREGVRDGVEADLLEAGARGGEESEANTPAIEEAEAEAEEEEAVPEAKASG